MPKKLIYILLLNLATAAGLCVTAQLRLIVPGWMPGFSFVRFASARQYRKGRRRALPDAAARRCNNCEYLRSDSAHFSGFSSRKSFCIIKLYDKGLYLWPDLGSIVRTLPFKVKQTLNNLSFIQNSLKKLT